MKPKEMTDSGLVERLRLIAFNHANDGEEIQDRAVEALLQALLSLGFTESVKLYRTLPKY